MKKYALFLLIAIFLAIALGPLIVWARGEVRFDADWRTADRRSTGIAPAAARTPEAVVQVYAARAFNWRGLFGIHTWIATKPAGASSYTVHQVIGWQLPSTGTALDSRRDLPDRRWYDASPWLLKDLRGPAAAALIPAIEAAVARYPYGDRYVLWPGPNSNSFVAWVAREVPALRLSLPVTAIGKDWLGDDRLLAKAPSGTGWQVSFGGYFGLLAAWHEGLELNLGGAVLGVDLRHPALKLPGVGRVGVRAPLL
ncbi:MAG TPA: DUF3750 domain-containing protein [Gammaproteobacteria bacterium]|nr:DUF3750 domain-containing protein [Gammaproteobacteria bacterium]